MNIAQQILKDAETHKFDISDMAQIAESKGEEIQDWGEGVTTFTFEDGSKLKFDDYEAREAQ